MPELKRIAIIGASAAGVAAAFALRRAGFDGHLSLYGDDVREPYERPALTKTLSGGHGGIHPIVAPPTPIRTAGSTSNLASVWWAFVAAR